MKTTAKTIQIFLPSGESRALRVAEITTRIVQAVQVSKLRLPEFFDRPESKHVGLYFLFGTIGENDQPHVYIGQTEDLVMRLRDHNSKKEFWKTAVVIISKTHSFTQAHIRYLEWLSIKQAIECERYTLDNANNGSKPFVTEAMEADVLDAFETIQTLTSTLGFPVFDRLVAKSSSSQSSIDGNEDIFELKGPSAEAKGKMVDEGFVVMEGSKARLEIVASAPMLKSQQAKYIQEGNLKHVEGDDHLIFTKDTLFDTPSGAGSIVLARSCNGWISWKNSEGKTLHDVYRADNS